MAILDLLKNFGSGVRVGGTGVTQTSTPQMAIRGAPQVPSAADTAYGATTQPGKVIGYGNAVPQIAPSVLPTSFHQSPTHTITTTTKSTPLVPATAQDGQPNQPQDTQQREPTNLPFIGDNGAGGYNVKSYSSGAAAPMESTPSPFYTPVDTKKPVDSSYLGNNTSYDSVMRARDLKQAAYQKANEDYLLQKAGYDNLVNMDKANEINAGFSGETTDFGQGASSVTARANALREIAAASKLNIAGVPLAVAKTGIDYANTNLENYYRQQTNTRSNAPEFSGQQVNQTTGDIYGFVRDPITGETKTQVMGNIYTGQYGDTSGGQASTQGSFGAANGGQFPSQLNGTVFNAPDGTPYVNQDKLTPGMERVQTMAAKAAGIPILSTGEVESLRNIDYVKQNINGMETVIKNILSPGLYGRAKDSIVNPIKNFLQSDTDISTFNGYRDTAIKIIQSLAGGPGSGLRLTGGEIATATSNIPTITDNLETAQNKIKLLNTFLDTKAGTILPPKQKQTSGGGGLYDF